MKVIDMINKLGKTKMDNEVRIVSNLEGFGQENTEKFHLSFDDVGDVLIYEIED